MIEIKITEHFGGIHPDLTITCEHCLQPITRTVNLHNMCNLITCINCGRTSDNGMVLLTDVKKRIYKHVESGNNKHQRSQQ